MCSATTRINWLACTCGRSSSPRTTRRGRRSSRAVQWASAPLFGAFRCRHKDGTVRWTEGVARNLLGEPTRRCHRRLLSRRHRPEGSPRPRCQRDRGSATAISWTPPADIIFEADHEGYFRFVNPVTLRVFGLSPRTEVVGRRFTEFIRADYRPAILQHYSQQVTVTACPNSYVEFPAVTKNGAEVWLGQNALARIRRRGQVHRHAGRGARHHRAQAGRGRAARRRGPVPSAGRAVAGRRVHPAERSACLRQSPRPPHPRLLAAGAARSAVGVLTGATNRIDRLWSISCRALAAADHGACS